VECAAVIDLLSTRLSVDGGEGATAERRTGAEELAARQMHHMLGRDQRVLLLDTIRATADL